MRVWLGVSLMFVAFTETASGKCADPQPHFVLLEVSACSGNTVAGKVIDAMDCGSASNITRITAHPASVEGQSLIVDAISPQPPAACELLVGRAYWIMVRDLDCDDDIEVPLTAEEAKEVERYKRLDALMRSLSTNDKKRDTRLRCPDVLRAPDATKLDPWGKATTAHLPVAVPPTFPGERLPEADMERAFQRCAEAAGLAKGAKKKVKVSWRIRPDGTITDARAENKAIDNKALTDCIAERWWFPITQKGGASSRVFDFSW